MSADKWISKRNYLNANQQNETRKGQNTGGASLMSAAAERASPVYPAKGTWMLLPVCAPLGGCREHAGAEAPYFPPYICYAP